MPKFKDWLGGLSASSLDDTADELPIRDDSADGMLRLTLSTLDARFVNVTGDTAAIGLSGASEVTVPAAADSDTETAARTTGFDSALGENEVNGDHIGDTGWRSVTVAGGWTGELWIRRTGNVCFANIQGMDAAARTTGTIYTLLTGFRASASVGPARTAVVDGTTTSTSRHLWLSGATALSIFSAASSSDLDGQISWPTDDAWPASLPGSAA